MQSLNRRLQGVGRGTHNSGGSNAGNDEEQRSEDESGIRGSEQRWRKLEIPLFSGDDAYGWVSQVERYFEVKAATGREKLQAGMIAMERKALTWFQWREFCTQDPTWEEFCSALIRQFQPKMSQNPYELLLGLKQTTIVEEYREQFELYAGPLKGTDPEYLKGIFLNGLKDIVRAELKLFHVGTLPEMIDYAQRIDEKNLLLQTGGSWSNKGGGGGFFRSYPYSKTGTWEAGSKMQGRWGQIVGHSGVESNSLKTSGSYSGREFKKLFDAEMKEKSKKGLCFRCDEKFGPDPFVKISSCKY